MGKLILVHNGSSLIENAQSTRHPTGVAQALSDAASSCSEFTVNDDGSYKDWHVRDDLPANLQVCYDVVLEYLISIDSNNSIGPACASTADRLGSHKTPWLSIELNSLKLMPLDFYDDKIIFLSPEDSKVAFASVVHAGYIKKTSVENCESQVISGLTIDNLDSFRNGGIDVYAGALLYYYRH